MRRPLIQRLIIVGLTITLSACGGVISRVKFGVITAKPIVQSMVPEIITQAEADIIKRDLDSGLAAATKCDNCWKSITSTGRQKDLAKAECALTAANDLRAILALHHIGGNPKLEIIAGIVQVAIDGFQEYHDQIAMSGDAAPTVDPKAAEKQLMHKLDDLNRQLKDLK